MNDTGKPLSAWEADLVDYGALIALIELSGEDPADSDLVEQGRGHALVLDGFSQIAAGLRW